MFVTVDVRDKGDPTKLSSRSNRLMFVFVRECTDDEATDAGAAHPSTAALAGPWLCLCTKMLRDLGWVFLMQRACMCCLPLGACRECINRGRAAGNVHTAADALRGRAALGVGGA